MFGRKLDMLKTIPVTPETLPENLLLYPVKSIIRINDDLELLLVYDNLDYSIINELNLDLSINLLKPKFSIVKSNAAIASATTAYSRINLMKYKTIPGIEIYYCDTDSVVVNKELPSHLVGKELGQMKDELNGGVIKEAYFFGIKKYGFIDDKNQVRTVFSGVPRNSLSWEDIVNLSQNKPVIKQIPDQFFKYLNKLEINIKQKNIEITFNPDKKLINNKFLPININEINGENSSFTSLFKQGFGSRAAKKWKNFLINIDPLHYIS